MENTRSTRRRALAAIGSGFAVSIAGCSGGGDATPTESSFRFAGSLVAEYGFGGDGDTVADRSGNGNEATIQGGASRTDGPDGQALSFDGEDDRVRTPVTYATLSDGLTFEAVARIDDLDSGWNWLFTQSEDDDQWSQLGGHQFGGGRTRWELRMADGYVATVDAPEGTITEGEWHHWVGTWNRSKGLRHYVDGELVASSENPDTCQRGCGSATGQGIGADAAIMLGAQGRDLEYLTGAIDHVRIYDRALSADEVATLVDG